nr:g-type lectin s-receptor-like serine/threonine-protein kinase [Quercus suber]
MAMRHQPADSLQLSLQLYLVSAKRNFTLGCFKPTSYCDDDNNNNQRIYLGIWYTNYGNNRPVWIGNQDRPISNDSRGFLTLDHLGKLMIKFDGGDPIVIYSGTGGVETKNTSVTLLDDGNGFIGRRLWESFDDPTDMLLPEN